MIATETDFLRKECQAEDVDEKHAAQYDAIYEIVEAEQMCEWIADRCSAWTFRPQGQAIHAEVVRRMKKAKK